MNQANHRIIKRTINVFACVLMLLWPLVSNGFDINTVHVYIGHRITNCFNEQLELKRLGGEEKKIKKIGLLILNNDESWLPLVPFGINENREKRPFLLGHAPSDSNPEKITKYSIYSVQCNNIIDEKSSEEIISINDKNYNTYRVYHKLHLNKTNEEKLEQLKTKLFGNKKFKIIVSEISISSNRKLQRLMIDLVKNIPTDIWKHICQSAVPSIEPNLEISESFCENSSVDEGNPETITQLPPKVKYHLTLPDGLEAEHIIINNQKDCENNQESENKSKIDILVQTDNQANCILKAGVLSFNLNKIIAGNKIAGNKINKDHIKKALYFNKNINLSMPSGIKQEVSENNNLDKITFEDKNAPADLYSESAVCGLLPETERLKILTTYKEEMQSISLYKDCKIYLFHNTPYFRKNYISKLQGLCPFKKGRQTHSDVWYCYSRSIEKPNIQPHNDWWTADPSLSQNKPLDVDSFIKPKIEIKNDKSEYKIIRVKYCLSEYSSCKEKSGDSALSQSLKEIGWNQDKLPENITIYYKPQNSNAEKTKTIIINQTWEKINLELERKYQYHLKQKLVGNFSTGVKMFWYSDESKCRDDRDNWSNNNPDNFSGSAFVMSSDRQNDGIIEAGRIINNASGPEDSWAFISDRKNVHTSCTQGKKEENTDIVIFDFELIGKEAFATLLILDPASDLSNYQKIIRKALENWPNKLSHNHRILGYRVDNDGRISKWLDEQNQDSQQLNDRIQSKLADMAFDNEIPDIFRLLDNVGQEAENIDNKRIIYITDGSDNEIQFKNRDMGIWLDWVLNEQVSTQVITLDCKYWLTRAYLSEADCLSLREYDEGELQKKLAEYFVNQK